MNLKTPMIMKTEDAPALACGGIWPHMFFHYFCDLWSPLEHSLSSFLFFLVWLKLLPLLSESASYLFETVIFINPVAYGLFYVSTLAMHSSTLVLPLSLSVF